MNDLTSDEVRILNIAILEYKEALGRFMTRFADHDGSPAPQVYADMVTCSALLRRLYPLTPHPSRGLAYT